MRDLKGIKDFLLQEIEKNIQIIVHSQKEEHDKYAKGKIKVFIDFLDRIDECENVDEFLESAKISRMESKGALVGIEIVISKLSS